MDISDNNIILVKIDQSLAILPQITAVLTEKISIFELPHDSPMFW